ncbi:MAG: Hpt domain-containing protein [Deltaproteobacteria bacterium]|nr:Hpt domain-containing protein [Deltaproteobacteria bacterium]
MTDLSLLQDFIMETGECLEEMESDLLHLKEEPGKQELWDNILRSVYTVKSAAEYFGIEQVAVLANEVEGLLNRTRHGRPGQSEAMIDLLLAVRKRIGRLLEEIGKDQVESTKIDDLLQQLQTLNQDSSPGQDFSEPTSVNKFDVIDFSDLNSSASAYEEEDDDELLEIFLEHLEKSLFDLQSQAATLFTADPAAATAVLNDCLSIIDSLNSSANYMGYARLVSLYEGWTRKLQAARELFDNENHAFSPASVKNLMQDYFAVIAEIFPRLQIPEAEEIAAAIDIPAPTENDTQPELARASMEDIGADDDSLDLLTAHAADTSAPTELSTTTPAKSQSDDKDLLARLSWSFDRQIARDPKVSAKSDSAEIETELFSSSAPATPDPTALLHPEKTVPIADDDRAVSGPGCEIADNLSAIFTEINPTATDDDNAESNDEELFNIFLEHLQSGLSDLLKQTELPQETTDEHLIAILKTIPTQLNSLRASANYMGYRQLTALYDTWTKEIQATPDPLRTDGNKAVSTLVDRIRTNIVQLLKRFSQLEPFREIKAGAATSKPTDPAAPLAEDLPTTTAPDDTPSAFAASAEPSAESETPAIADLTMLQDFIVEAMEHLEEMENNLLRLDADPDGPEILNDIFRSIHTIKGAAEYLGIKRIAKLSHNLENLLYKLRQHDLAVNREVMDLLIAGRDRLNQLTDNLKQSQAEKTEIDDLLERLRLINQEKVGPRLSPTTENHAQETTARPAVDPEQDLTPSLTEIEALLKAENAALLQGNDRRDPEKHSRRRTDQINEKKLKQSFRVEAGKIDELMNQVGELVVSRVGFNQLLRELREFQQERRFDPREMKRLTGLTFRLNEATVLLGRVANELQESVMKVRMLPISQLFNRYPRLVFDLVRDVDKEVQLDIHGADTELDKMVIEEISDPLIHIIRNAVDHGIETTAERRKKGKPEIGTIRLEAYHEGNHVVVNIIDDGRGIDLNRVRGKALAGRFATMEELERMSKREITELIMKPGFSTAETVTRISGRGVGMDVVRKNIEKLNGTIEIDTTPGSETRFRIKIPLTLAIIPALRVKVSDELFTIPLSTVKETIRLNHDAIATINGKEVITLRHNTLSLVRLANLFKLNETRNDSRQAFVVVVSTGMKEVGLVVDALLGQEEVVIKPLEDYIQEKSGFSGATILGDGRISLILDVYELINLFMSREAGKRNSRPAS